jgi:hypothetical protein
MADLQDNLDELKVHQREAKALLAKSLSQSDVKNNTEAEKS